MVQAEMDFKRRNIQINFEQFDDQNPEIYDKFKTCAIDLINTGKRRIGAKAIMEHIRWDYMIRTKGDVDWKVNNNYTSRYARKLITECPWVATYMELRELKT